METETLLEKIRQLREYLHKRQGQSLKVFVDECAEFVLLYRDSRFVTLSSIAYAFFKFYDKPYIGASKELDSCAKEVDFHLSKASELLKAGDEKGFDRELQGAEHEVYDLSAHLGRHIMNIIFKARLKSAANVYAHGASLGIASFLCSVDKDELSDYIGHTTIHEKYKTMDVRERMADVYAALGR